MFRVYLPTSPESARLCVRRGGPRPRAARDFMSGCRCEGGARSTRLPPLKMCSCCEEAMKEKAENDDRREDSRVTRKESLSKDRGRRVRGRLPLILTWPRNSTMNKTLPIKKNPFQLQTGVKWEQKLSTKINVNLITH